MIEPQPIIEITSETLLAKVGEMQEQCHRLVHITATRLPETMELTYSFDRDGRFVNLRLQIPAANPRLPSITGIYWSAFIYENELHDLFGIQVDGNVLDFKGEFYKTTVPFPYASPPPVVAPKTAVPAAPGPVTPATTSASNPPPPPLTPPAAAPSTP